MSELSEILASLGLEQYHDALISEGFDTWDTVQDITENDLDTLNFKLGHRRKLQRYIASQRGLNLDQPLISPHPDVGGERVLEGNVSTEGQAERPAAETKRKYRRHPKPDENAPERPPSAYVLFSNHIREEIKGKDLSFTDIAKLVGQRWQALNAAEREPYETRAANLKETFNQNLAEYKKSERYRHYTQYLAQFRAKHGGGPADGKRPKLEEEASGGSSGSPVVPTLSSTGKLSDLSETSRQGTDLTQLRGTSSAQVTDVSRSSVNSPFSSHSHQGQGSTEGVGQLPGQDAEQGQGPAARARGVDRTPPQANESAGYFDPLARHARERSNASRGGRPPPVPLEGAPQAAQAPKPPPLKQEASISSVPSTMSYGSASSGLPWTPKTPRDDQSSRPGNPETSLGKGSWDMPRPILPPFQPPPGHSLTGIHPLTIPDRSFGHGSDQNLRLPPPNLSLGSGSSETHLQIARATAAPPPPHFLEQSRGPGQRGEQAQEVSRPGTRREESGIDLLARAIDADQREKRRS